jgi:glutamate-ammonia-ligase adenylyltransferase
MTPNPEELKKLLTGEADPGRAAELLAPVGFADVTAAFERLRRTGGTGESAGLLAACLPTLLLTLSYTAQPDQALINFERFAQSVPDRGVLFRSLRDNPRMVEILVRLFVGSQFLTEILLCAPAHLDRLRRVRPRAGRRPGIGVAGAGRRRTGRRQELAAAAGSGCDGRRRPLDAARVG